MIYGDKKIKSMVKSILPSVHRRGAREDKTLLKRGARRLARQQLKMLDDDFEASSETDLQAYPEHKIRYVVRDRRDYDKTKPLQRWAVSVTKLLSDPESRLSYMRSILPKNLIGRHALTHLTPLQEFDTNPMLRVSRRDHFSSSWTPDLSYDQMVIKINDILTQPGGHTRLNKAIEHVTCEYRVWIGRHQVAYSDRWIDDYQITQVGPLAPPRLIGLGHVEEWLEQLHTWSMVPRRIRLSTPQTQFFTSYDGRLLQCTLYDRANPEYHPEWWQSLLTALNNW